MPDRRPLAALRLCVSTLLVAAVPLVPHPNSYGPLSPVIFAEPDPTNPAQPPFSLNQSSKKIGPRVDLRWPLFSMVPEEGLEPSHRCRYRILSPDIKVNTTGP